MYQGFENLFELEPQATFTLEHRLLHHNHLDLSLYASDTRVLLHLSGESGHLFELVWDGKEPEAEPHLKLFEAFEGVAIKEVIASPANRFGVVTEAGEAFLLGYRDTEPGPIDLELEEDEEVVHFGLGSSHEIVVTDRRILARGSSELTSSQTVGLTSQMISVN